MSNILITGAKPSGFGLLTARKFAEAGHTVHAGFRSKDRAGDLEALAIKLPNIRPVRLDVTDQALIDAVIAKAQTSGPIDVLINNATDELGVSVSDFLSDVPLTRQFDTNVFGVVRMIRAVAPEMRRRKQGATGQPLLDRGLADHARTGRQTPPASTRWSRRPKPSGTSWRRSASASRSCKPSASRQLSTAMS